MSNYKFDGAGSGVPSVIAFDSMDIDGNSYWSQYLDVFILYGNYVGAGDAPVIKPTLPQTIAVKANLNAAPSFSDESVKNRDSVMVLLGRQDIFDVDDPRSCLGAKFIFGTRVLPGDDTNAYICSWYFGGANFNSGIDVYSIPPMSGLSGTFGPAA